MAVELYSGVLWLFQQRECTHCLSVLVSLSVALSSCYSVIVCVHLFSLSQTRTQSHTHSCIHTHTHTLMKFTLATCRSNSHTESQMHILVPTLTKTSFHKQSFVPVVMWQMEFLPADFTILQDLQLLLQADDDSLTASFDQLQRRARSL